VKRTTLAVSRIPAVEPFKSKFPAPAGVWEREILLAEAVANALVSLTGRIDYGSFY
jgi:hypothetical protein